MTNTSKLIFGRFMASLGGSLGQLLMPRIIMITRVAEFCAILLTYLIWVQYSEIDSLYAFRSILAPGNAIVYRWLLKPNKV